MSDLPESLDLKFLPDWLKESESPRNRYADFEGERPPREGRGDFRGPRPGGDRGPRPGGPRPGGMGRGPGGPRRDDRGPRPEGDRSRGPRPPGKGPPRGGRRDDRGPRQEMRPPAPPPPIKPLNVKVEFVPEPGLLVAIAKEMRSSHRAYPVFSAAKMILSKMPMHRVRITANEPGITLYQLGEGTITSDRTLLERDAFRQLKDKYFREEVQQNEPPKGTFTNVAKLRESGLLLGPTNHHAYQPMLRRIYEERYARRMPFPEFQQREIEVVNDEQSINDWKEQARSVKTYITTQEPEPLTFKTLAEAEAFFRTTYLPQEIKSGTTLDTNGSSMRNGPDRALGLAIGEAFDKEIAFPFNVVNAMRPAFSDAGLTFFKHRKRVVYASSVRPLRHPEGQPARENVLAILRAIDANPRCVRHDLAVKLLGKDFDAPEKAQEKIALASDLHYLLLAGHVIEFVDGRLDLPLAPKAQAEAGKSEASDAAEEAEPAPAAEATPEPLGASVVAEAVTPPEPVAPPEPEQAPVEASPTEPVAPSEPPVAEEASTTRD